MATNAENLATIKSNILVTLATITADAKPSYNIDGQSISWTEYHRMLMEQLTSINQLINAETPYEEHSVGFT